MTIARTALLLLLVVPIAAEARHRPRPDPYAPPGRFVVESALPPETVIGCLSASRAQPAVLAVGGARRVLLGPNDGWIDVSAHAGGSVLATRTEWVDGPVMQRWATACVANAKPPPPGFWSGKVSHVSLKRLWPGVHRPS